MNQTFTVLIVITTIFLLVRLSNTYVYIKSNIDNRVYRVKRNKMSQQSADLLALINQRLEKLIEFSNSKIPEPRYKKNIRRFNSNNTSENILELDTTYTMNKGDSMIFCISPRNKETVSLYDINTMMYVAIHELAHIASDSIGHTEEFKQNFKLLLKDAMELDIYTYVNYKEKPVEYCGININSSIV